MAPKQQRVDFAFSPVTKEERAVEMEKEFTNLDQRLEVERSKLGKDLLKRPVGRPKKTEMVLLKPKVEKMKRTAKVRGSYTNWFTPVLWPPIFNAMRQCRCISTALSFLRAAYRKPRDLISVYDNLSKNSMRDWFHPNGDLKDTYKRCVKFSTYFSKSAQHCPVLESYPALKEEICSVLKKMRTAGQPLYAVCIQPIIRAIILEKAPQILEGTHATAFRVSYEWTKNFVKSKLNWSYRASTTAAGKLPKDFEEQGRVMAQRCAYLVKVHNIPMELVVNSDQTGIHLVPTGGSRTWETKGSKHVKVHGAEDKRQITVAVSSAANGHCLPFQVIFQGATTKSLPKQLAGRAECEQSGWNITYSHNHWSTLDTSKEFVSKILKPYLLEQIQLNSLPLDQEMIWLIDCWSVHISKEFREWMKSHHPEIHVLYIPANCTSIFQLADVVIQRPFKHAFRQEFNQYTTDIITRQLKGKEEIHIDFKMSTLKPHICHWLFNAWKHVSSKTSMIRKGWEQAGLLRAFDTEFQKGTMLENMEKPLFSCRGEEEEQTFDKECNEEIDVEVSLDTVMENSLSRVAELSKNINTNRMTTIRELARKRN